MTNQDSAQEFADLVFRYEVQTYFGISALLPKNEFSELFNTIVQPKIKKFITDATIQCIELAEALNGRIIHWNGNIYQKDAMLKAFQDAVDLRLPNIAENKLYFKNGGDIIGGIRIHYREGKYHLVREIWEIGKPFIKHHFCIDFDENTQGNIDLPCILVRLIEKSAPPFKN